MSSKEVNIVILVDENDQQIGICDKMKAHQEGLLHRAFSIFVFNSKDQLLLQRRASTKYHSPSKWTNTCCSHDVLNESIEEFARKRLVEEMGIKCALNKAFTNVYNLDCGNGMIEHEFNHIFYGFSDELPILNTLEADEYRYATLEEIQKEVMINPDQYTEWFKILVPHFNSFTFGK